MGNQGLSVFAIRAIGLLGMAMAISPCSEAVAADNADIVLFEQARSGLAGPAFRPVDRDSSFHSAFGELPMAEPAPQPAAAVVTFGRALDLSGQRRIYSSRSSISGLGSVISFSNRRPRPVFLASAALRSLALPAGMPVAARSLTSGFGMRSHPLLGGRRLHAGIDLAAPTGTPIVATSDGVVSVADWSGGYGLLVSIEHGAGLQTRYGHMSQLAVTRGQAVRRGDIIGYVGSTGRSTGPHLHYEMRIDGQAVDPRR